MSNNKKGVNLGSERIGKLLFQLALPAIIAQIVNVLYNIIDRIFIGRVDNGAVAMAGVGVAFPIIVIISAFSALIGSGGAPLLAIKMGEKDEEGARKILSNSFSMLIILSIILTIGFLIFKKPILMAFGASEATLPYAMQYLSIYLIGTIFVLIALGFNPFINAQGFAKIGMLTVMIGAIINIVLDPIFIFGFGLGVKGAALATIIAQMVSALWVLKFILKDSPLKLKKEYLMPNSSVTLRIIALGIAPFIMQATESLVIVSMNNQLVKFGGDIAVGSMTILSSIMQMILLPIVGMTQGAQPIISYNFGAKAIDRVKKTFKLLIVCCLAYTVTFWLLLMGVPEFFVKIFNNDPVLIEMTSWSIKLFFGGALMLGAQIACQQTFLALGQAKISLFLAMLRKIILLVPLIFILPKIMKGNELMATFIAESVADVLATTITVITFVIFYKKTLSKIDSLENENIEEKIKANN
ncbi:MAG: MATE family efflux transporter [Sarcina sp.]